MGNSIDINEWNIHNSLTDDRVHNSPTAVGEFKEEDVNNTPTGVGDLIIREVWQNRV